VTERDIVICKCGHWNRRSGRKRWWRRFTCEKCGQRLVAARSGWDFSAGLGIVVLVVGAALGIGYLAKPPVAPKQDAIARAAPPAVVPSAAAPSTDPAAPAAATADPRSAKRRDAEPRAGSRPPTGVVERSRKKNAIATLELETPAGSDYLVKIVNVVDSQDQIVIYIRGGETYSTKVPLGRYYARAAIGKTWYGKKELFGPDTIFFRFIEASPTAAECLKVFQFNVQGRQITGIRIVFQESLLGNMQQESISRDDFVD
jgi:hypothetical protein